jgi:branched-chain amino acid transport system substrate-binding protein
VLDSSAITKIHSVIIAVIIVVATIAGSLAYIILSGQEQGETIKIGVLADLDAFDGKNVWQGAVLAAEQLNAEGDILGKQVVVVGEDTDISTGVDPAKINAALIRLLTYHKVDFIIGMAADQGFMVQEVIAEHKTIFFEVATTEDSYTQRVVDDYDAYKYFFRVAFNATSIFQGITDALLLLREQTGFNKVGYIGEDLSWAKGIMQGLDYVLPGLYGFDLVYKGAFPPGTFDFSSYFATAETAGVEIMVPLISVRAGAIPFVKEYGDRQSPMVIYGGWLGGGVTDPEGWEITDGKCEYISVSSFPTVAGFPLTSKTIPDREAYINRWGEIPTNFAANAYDVLRYILPDAIERAGTIETEAVIEALETTSIETTNARDFVFTSSHDLMMGENPNNPEADYTLAMLFQWIDGEQVPVYPEKIMEEAGVTYTYPDWPGPWDK